MTTYAPEWTMRRAREAYFTDNKFGADGGYSDRWVKVKVGFIPVVFPNLPARVRAVKIHDMHHILTGYQTDMAGEWQISAWEIASGCRGFVAAWFLNLSGIMAGLLTHPVLTFRAFVRGRRSQNLYAHSIDDILEWTVADTRQKLSVCDNALKPTFPERALFVLANRLVRSVTAE